jgi:hypothetical protein
LLFIAISRGLQVCRIFSSVGLKTLIGRDWLGKIGEKITWYFIFYMNSRFEREKLVFLFYICCRWNNKKTLEQFWQFSAFADLISRERLQSKCRLKQQMKVNLPTYLLPTLTPFQYWGKWRANKICQSSSWYVWLTAFLKCF